MCLHSTPNARAFLEVVFERYRALTSYSDTGLSHRPNCRHEHLCKFRTDYAAPHGFRFEFELALAHGRQRFTSHRTVVGAFHGEPYSFDEGPGPTATLEMPESLDLALAGATGLSAGTVHTIGTLLFAEVSGFTLLNLRRPRFRKDRIVDGVRCKAVSGLHPRGGRLTAWFGESDLLLRRLVRTRFRAEELRTSIRTGHDLPEDLFRPPKG